VIVLRALVVRQSEGIILFQSQALITLLSSFSFSLLVVVVSRFADSISLLTMLPQRRSNIFGSLPDRPSLIERVVRERRSPKEQPFFSSLLPLDFPISERRTIRDGSRVFSCLLPASFTPGPIPRVSPVRRDDKEFFPRGGCGQFFPLRCLACCRLNYFFFIPPRRATHSVQPFSISRLLRVFLKRSLLVQFQKGLVVPTFVARPKRPGFPSFRFRGYLLFSFPPPFAPIALSPQNVTE